MKTLIKTARIIDPASSLDRVGDIAIADGKIVGLGTAPSDFYPERSIDAQGLVACPGLVDLCARLREPGYEHEGMLKSELSAAAAGGVTSLVCPPDTQPVLDAPSLIEMLEHRVRKQQKSRVYPLGAITKGLKGEALAEMSHLAARGCVGFSQADTPIANTQILQRAMQYAQTFGYTLWLRPQELHLGKGVAASGALATRLGLSGVPVAAETIALHTLFELMRTTGAQVHLQRLSSAQGVQLLKEAKAQGLAVSADVSVHNLHLIDADIGYFDSRARLTPVLRSQLDRAALQSALQDGTIDALVSDHTPVEADEKLLPFGESTPGASAVELLLPLALKWGQQQGMDLCQSLDVVTHRSGKILRSSSQNESTSMLGQLQLQGSADICLFDPKTTWSVSTQTLLSQSKYTPFAHDMSGTLMQGRVKKTWIAGQLVYEAIA